MKLRIFASTLLVLASGGLAGCGEASAATDSGAADAAPGDAAPADSSVDADVDADVDAELDAGLVCGAVEVRQVRGAILDETGAGLEGARPQVCARLWPDDRLSCLTPPFSAADGSFEVAVPTDASCMTHAAMRIFRAGYGTGYCPFELTSIDGIVSIPEPLTVFSSRPPVAAPPEGDPAAAREARFDGGLTLEVVPDRLGLGLDYASLGARRVPVDPALCFDGAGDAIAAWVFADEGPVVGAPFPIAIDNDLGLGPGDTVELFVLGGLETRLSDGTLVDEATLGRIGSATVSADGATLRSAPGEGLPYFSWLVIR